MTWPCSAQSPVSDSFINPCQQNCLRFSFLSRFAMSSDSSFQAGPSSATTSFSFSSSASIVSPTSSFTVSSATPLQSGAFNSTATLFNTTIVTSEARPTTTRIAPLQTSTTLSSSAINAVVTPSSEANSRSNSNRVLNAVEVGTISAAAVVVLLGLLALIWFLVRRRRSKKKRNCPSNQNTDEKYAEDTKFFPDKLSSENTGKTPLLQVPSLHSRGNSSSTDSDVESQYYQDGRSSPYLASSFSSHEDNVIVHQPPDVLHNIPLDDTPTAAQSHEGYMHPAALTPSASYRPVSQYEPFQPPHSQPSQAQTQPPAKPVAQPPSRRPSRKQSVRTSPMPRHASPALYDPHPTDAGYDSDDSASLYSQASASTRYTSQTRLSTVALSSINNPGMTSYMPTIPQSPAHPSSSSAVGDRQGSQEGGLTTEEVVMVATLLKSRQRKTSNPDPPSRSDSVVSHIERKGSIKPAKTIIDSEGYTSRRLRSKYLEKKRGSTSYVPPSPLPDSSQP